MSSLGSFWFSCSSLLFHAALLFNSSGPVTRVLPLSLSLSFLYMLSLSLFSLSYISSLFVSLVTFFSSLIVCPLLPFPGSSCFTRLKISNREQWEDWERACTWEREVKEHAWMVTTAPYHSFQAAKGTALHLPSSFFSPLQLPPPHLQASVEQRGMSCF